ncbi:hypothetical protein [Candidatus Methylacidithermus pantelleriae]|nr:hypothetical protein [Candidatus Methylacidithermus pantelleriae]
MVVSTAGGWGRLRAAHARSEGNRLRASVSENAGLGAIGALPEEWRRALRRQRCSAGVPDALPGKGMIV